MYVPAHFPETVQMYHDTYFWINQCVGINVAMPMFTLIAGFLFSYLYDKGKYQEALAIAESNTQISSTSNGQVLIGNCYYKLNNKEKIDLYINYITYIMNTLS